MPVIVFFFFQAEDGIRDLTVTGVQTCALPISRGPNSATLFTPLHLWDKRTRPDQHVKAIIGAAFKEFAKIPEAFILAFNAPSIRGLGATGGFSVQIQDPSGGDFKKFSAVAEEFIAKARQDPAIGALGTNFRVSSPRLYAHVKRERA